VFEPDLTEVRDVYLKRFSPGLSLQGGSFNAVDVDRYRMAVDLGEEQDKLAFASGHIHSRAIPHYRLLIP